MSVALRTKGPVDRRSMSLASIRTTLLISMGSESKANVRSRRGRRPSASRRSGRWTHICAWDGHELADLDYVQISPHERVCRFHQSLFQTWLNDTSQLMYRSDEEEDAIPIRPRQRT